MTTETNLPSALYAAAGVADMAREQIEKIPGHANRISEQVSGGKLKDKAYDLGGRAVGELAGLGGRAYAELSTLRSKAGKGLSKEKLTTEADRARDAARGAARRSADKVAEAFEMLVERGVIVLDGEKTKPVKAEVVINETAKSPATATAATTTTEPATTAEAPAAAEATTDPKPVRKVAKKAISKPME